MEMYKKVGDFKPDSLIVSPDYPILKEGIGLKAGQGVLKRGSLIMKGTDKAGYIAGTAGEGLKLFGILADETDTGTDNTADNIPVIVYQSGEFNREAVFVSGEGATVDTYEDDLKGINIYLRSVQNYE